jgi:hypothetical protein
MDLSTISPRQRLFLIISIMVTTTMQALDATIAFLDVFVLMMFASLTMLPLVFLIRRPKAYLPPPEIMGE